MKTVDIVLGSSDIYHRTRYHQMISCTGEEKIKSYNVTKNDALSAIWKYLQ